jgi:hypothetical protein
MQHGFSLFWVAVVTGGVLVLGGAACAAAPAGVWRGIRAFPRHALAGRLLTAIALAWVAWLLVEMPLGRFERFKPLLWILAPGSFVLIVMYVDELLAPRALGGLLLLLATPMLDAARWHGSPARFVIAALAFALVLVGMLLFISPYRFRTQLAWMERPGAARAAGIGAAAAGAAVFALGLVAY